MDRHPRTRARLAAAALLVAVTTWVAGCSAPPPHEGPAAPRTWGLAGLGVPVLVQGRGPVLVCVNGGSMGLRQWDALAARLDDDHTVVRFDLPGWGGAAPPDSPYDPIEVLVDLLDRLEAERATLVGFSYGGSLAVDAALAHPDRVEALVLLAPAVSGYPWPASVYERHVRLKQLYEEQGADALIEATLDEPSFAPTAADDPALREQLRGLMAESAALFGLDPSLVIQPDRPAWEHVDELACPVQLVLFERDEPELVALGDALLARVERLEPVGVRGVGHMGAVEDPDGVADVMRPFLARLAAR